MTFASTSQMYATSELRSLEKFCACTMPRPLTPITATRTVSLGDQLVRCAPARIPIPATVVCLTKSRRSMSVMSSPALLQHPDLDIPEPHHVIVVLQHDLSLPSHREPLRILRVLAFRKRGVERRRAEIERDDADAVEPVLTVIPAKDES